MMTLLAGLLLWAAPGQATSIPTGELIVNGGFTTDLSSWTTSGTANRRVVGNAINANGGNSGFNGSFGSAFAALGDLSAAIGGDPDNGGIHSISQSFLLPAVWGGFMIESYDLTISFRTAFDGRDENTGSTTGPRLDVFSATLSGIPLFSQNSLNFPSGAPSTASADNQLVNDPLSSFPLFGLLPGTYTLAFTLFEDNGTGVRFTNTAAGIDEVSITGSASTVPEPGTLVLLGGGLAALALFGRRAGRK
jgi:hypothetical protein